MISKYRILLNSSYPFFNLLFTTIYLNVNFYIIEIYINIYLNL